MLVFMRAIVMLRLFIMQCLVWCIKNNMHCIISKKKNYLLTKIRFINRGKDVERDLRGKCVFKHANTFIRTLFIANTMISHVLVILRIILNTTVKLICRSKKCTEQSISNECIDCITSVG